MKNPLLLQVAFSALLFTTSFIHATTTLVSYSGPFHSADVVKIDADRLQVTTGIIVGSGSNEQDLAFDISGRLFGVQDGTVYEYDPISLATLHSKSLGGALNGLAARDRMLYTYSGPFHSAGVVKIDADSLQVASGVIVGSSSNEQDLAFDQSGRLFGVQDGTVYEYDPVSLAVLNSMAVGGALNGLVGIPEPSSSALFVMALLLIIVRMRRHSVE